MWSDSSSSGVVWLVICSTEAFSTILFTVLQATNAFCGFETVKPISGCRKHEMRSHLPILKRNHVGSVSSVPSSEPKPKPRLPAARLNSLWVMSANGAVQAFGRN